jgi:hypothetical protein
MGLIRGPNIVRSGLILHLDAALSTSYPASGTVWYDLSPNRYNFNFSCTGTSCSNPTYSNNSITANFVTTSPYNFSYLNGTNLNNQILQLLYSNHTIELCFKLNSASTVYNYNNALTNENNMALFCWVGYHAGLLMSNSTFAYTIYNSTTSANFITADATPFIGQNIVLHCIRSGNDCSIYINGVLKNTVTISPPASYPHANIRIGCGFTTQPTSNSYTFASNATYYSIKCYNIALTATQVVQNFNALRGRLLI